MGLIVLRVRPTLTWFPNTILDSPVDKTPMHFIPSAWCQWGCLLLSPVHPASSLCLTDLFLLLTQCRRDWLSGFAVNRAPLSIMYIPMHNAVMSNFCPKELLPTSNIVRNVSMLVAHSHYRHKHPGNFFPPFCQCFSDNVLMKPHRWPRYMCLQDDTNMLDRMSEQNRYHYTPMIRSLSALSRGKKMVRHAQM